MSIFIFKIPNNTNNTGGLMSTIQAKQEICLNISTLRCLSSFSSGRYCLRFTLTEQTSNSNSHHKYAIPVTVLEYSSSSYNSGLQPILTDTSYTTKPFIIKPNYSTQINELCIFKYNINMFHNRYAQDYHDIVMKCCCELVAIQYGKETGRVVSIFYGKIKGAGVSDALVIDFYEGIACQIVGSVYSCVYQVEFIGASVRQQDFSQIKNTGERQIKNKYLDSIKNNEANILDHSITQSTMNSQTHSQLTLTFEMYCQTQPKEYVQSLLQYLLGELKKSEDKMNLNLSILEQILSPSISNLKIQNVQLTESLDMEINGSIGNLESSIRERLGMDNKETGNMKQKLEIIKQYQEEYEDEDDEEFFSDREEDDQIYVEDDINMDHHDIEYTESLQYNQYTSPVRNNKNNKNSPPDIEDECIILTPEDDDNAEDQVINSNTKNNKGKSYARFLQNNQHSFEKVSVLKLNEFVNKTQTNTRQIHEVKNAQNDRFEGQGFVEKQVEADSEHLNPMRNRKRKKIFAQSNPHNIQKQPYSNIDTSPKYPIFPYKNNHPKLQISEQTQNLHSLQSVYPPRQIPQNITHQHPNSLASRPRQSQPPNHSLTIPEFEMLLHENSLKIYQKWRKFISQITQTETQNEKQKVIDLYYAQYIQRLQSLLNQSVVRFGGSWDVDIYAKQQALRGKMAKQMRGRVKDDEINPQVNQFKFYDSNLWSRNKTIMFEESYIPQLDKKQKISLVSALHNTAPPHHLVFLVHGLGACRLDMEKFKIQLKRYYKDKYILVSSSANEGRTEGDIDMMGVRLANEVDQEISRRINKDKVSLKVSFVGHSMGGIIIRSALPRLEKYKNIFYSYVSLSSPHIGYNYSSSKLVDVGLWLINNWRKCQSILQLTMSDSPPNKKFQMQSTYLYKLSMQKGLEWFKKVTFVASRQDHYVPYFSARVQKHDICLQDLKDNNQYAVTHSKMVDNILSRITGTVNRVDVNFSIVQQNIDNLIGRAAHICFLNHTEFLRLVAVVDADGWL